MTSNDVLYALLVASLAVSCGLILAALVMTGKKLADRGYQKAAGINGTMRIQSSKELRTYALRACVGVTFGGFAILLMADAPMLVRQWFNRSLFVLLPLGYLIATALDWLAEQEQLRLEIAATDAGRVTTRDRLAQAEAARSAQLQADAHDYQQMAAEAIAALRVATVQARVARGEAPVPEMAAVVPEHSSPVTIEQQAVAEKQTMRADLVASSLALGIPPRTSAHSDAPNPEVDVASIQPAAIAEITQAIKDAGKEG
jgi:hypothetical protein